MIAASITLLGDKELMRALGRVADALRDEAIQKGLYAAAVRTVAHAVATPPRIDTGFMVNSIYLRTPMESTYAAAKAAAEARNPDERMMDEVTTPDRNTAIVACGAEYAVYNEYGTSRMGAHPFMRPAIENNAEDIVQAFTVTAWRVIGDAVR